MKGRKRKLCIMGKRIVNISVGTICLPKPNHFVEYNKSDGLYLHDPRHRATAVQLPVVQLPAVQLPAVQLPAVPVPAVIIVISTQL